ncbi:hypothetical protein FRAAL2143 [Frankia alni ACN14a]|uniref:Uncharacterized protein n=1 Tax=Frankia alni (strain DSM 45986 / CECT 9034 / ACN14a) TaxID=326424 RepID=Q0RNU4_FRAAA|nr:hypothetical protein FRAAL2143 [Frankia alni ACN14a]
MERTLGDIRSGTLGTAGPGNGETNERRPPAREEGTRTWHAARHGHPREAPSGPGWGYSAVCSSSSTA